MKRLLLLAALALATACGSSAGSSSTTSEPTDTTSGDEAQTTSAQGDAQTVRMGAAPIAVPLPGIRREALRPELQELWSRVEDALALAPPPAPEANDDDAIAAWANGPFTEWIRQRVRATQQASAVVANVPELSPVERGFAIALVSFAFEDMAASARGTPVPDWITEDPRLLGIYAEAIDRALLPVAEYAATGFDGCVHVFEEAADPAWREWAPFCGQHLDDLREVFGRYARPEPAPVTP